MKLLRPLLFVLLFPFLALAQLECPSGTQPSMYGLTRDSSFTQHARICIDASGSLVTLVGKQNATVFADVQPGADIGAKVNAIAVSFSGGPGKIIIPPGAYLLSTQITWSTPGIHLQGGGRDATILQQTSPTAYGITMAAGANESRTEYLTVSMASGVTATGGARIRIQANHCSLSNVIVSATFAESN